MKKYLILLAVATAMLFACTPEENSLDDNTYTPLERHICKSELSRDDGGVRETIYFLYNWDGDKLTSIRCYNCIDSALRMLYEIEWDGDKVSGTRMSRHNYSYIDDGEEYHAVYHYNANTITSIECFDPSGETLSECRFAHSKGKITQLTAYGREDTTTVKLEWAGDNVSKLYRVIEGTDFLFDEYTYDNKKNPFYLPEYVFAELLIGPNSRGASMIQALGFLNGPGPIVGSTDLHWGFTMTPNNTVHVKCWGTYANQDISYSYDGDWPVIKTFSIPDIAENAEMRFYYKE